MKENYTLRSIYILLTKAFEIKKRLYKYYYLEEIGNIDIFKYLSTYKWAYDKGLELSDMVSDIINLDNYKLYTYMHK